MAALFYFKEDYKTKSLKFTFCKTLAIPTL